MRHLLLLLITISLLFSCNYKRKYIIPEDDFIDILVDIHLTEALFTVTKIKQEKYPLNDSLNIYDSIITRHGYTTEQYDSTMAYHSRQPVEFQILYDKVIEELNKLEGETLEELKNPDDPSKDSEL